MYLAAGPACFNRRAPGPGATYHRSNPPPMATTIAFTNNYRDLSTDTGFQFEFSC